MKNLKTMLTLKKNKGFTIAEFVVVFLIFLVIAASAYGPLSNLMVQWRTNKFVESMNIMVQTIQKAHSKTGRVQTTWTSAAVSNNKWIDGRYVTDTEDGAVLTAPWDKPFTVTAGNNSSELLITLKEVPKNYCIALAERALSSDMFTSGKVGAVPVKPENGKLNPALLGSSCATIDGTGDMILSFKVR